MVVIWSNRSQSMSPLWIMKLNSSVRLIQSSVLFVLIKAIASLIVSVKVSKSRNIGVYQIFSSYSAWFSWCEWQCSSKWILVRFEKRSKFLDNSFQRLFLAFLIQQLDIIRIGSEEITESVNIFQHKRGLCGRINKKLTRNDSLLTLCFPKSNIEISGVPGKLIKLMQLWKSQKHVSGTTESGTEIKSMEPAHSEVWYQVGID